MSKVLCLYFSQTGQLQEIVKSITAPLAASAHAEVQLAKIEPAKPFPFPWPFTQFFNTFPECNYADPIEVKPLPYTDEELASFDLVILAYQVWFLSPSLPISSFLQTSQAKVLLENKPVITVIGCRNMWLMAQEAMKQTLQSLNARLIDNIVLTDSAGAALSFISTPLWVLTGKKGPIGVIPAAGVSETKIQQASRFGDAIAAALQHQSILQSSVLQGLGAVEIHENLIASEKVAKKGFLLWGKLIRAAGSKSAWLRKPLVYLYVIYLVTLILTVVPLSALIKKLAAPLLRKKIEQQVAYYAQPSGVDSSKIKAN